MSAVSETVPNIDVSHILAATMAGRHAPPSDDEVAGGEL